MRNLNVTGRFLADSEIPSVFQDISLILDRSPIKVVVAMVDYLGIQQLILNLEFDHFHLDCLPLLNFLTLVIILEMLMYK